MGLLYIYMDDFTCNFLCKGMCSFGIKLYWFQNNSLLYNEGVSDWLRTRAVRLTRATVINARSDTDDDGVMR
jgi:hypothetical protein